MLRIFRRNFTPETILELTSNEIHHLKSLRIFNRDKTLLVLDGKGTSYSYYFPSGSVRGELVPSSRINHPPMPTRAIGGAIPKGNRLDTLLRMGTEIGVTEFYFFAWERSVREEFSIQRAERILIEASSQSERIFLPCIFQYNSWKEILRVFGQNRLLVLDPKADANLRLEDLRERIPLVGPEGGLSSEEIRTFQETGIPIRSLGPGILRIETAYICIASIMRQLDLEIIESQSARIQSQTKAF